MKRTLLSRMMAVYASAGYTLVLRSLELEGCRYHQRGEAACSLTLLRGALFDYVAYYVENVSLLCHQ
jgi:hypothetical protein